MIAASEKRPLPQPISRNVLPARSSVFNAVRIDSIALNGISEHAYPGCQVLVAKSGKVIYNKSFGHHTYEKKRAVINSDIYDLASITKISASVLSIMRLQDEGKFNLDLNLHSNYFKRR